MTDTLDVARYWQRALSTSPQLAFVVDTERRIVAVSAGMAQRCGASADELSGRLCSSLMHGSDAPPECPLRDLLLDAGTHESEVYSEVLGTHLFVTVTPLPDADGRVTHVLHVATDIEEGKRREAELRASEEHFAALFYDAPLGYQSLDEDGVFLTVNPMWTQTLGYEEYEVVGRWFGEFLAPEYVEAFRKRFPLFKAQGTIHSEFEMLHKDGSRHTIAFEGRIGREPDGRFRQTHCILSDVTKERQAAESLRRSLSGAVEALATTVEMRDPYTSGHQRRVAELAVAIAQRLDWPPGRVADLQVAALLHDVGKVVVPAEILTKPTALTFSEFELVKAHATATAEILAPIEFPTVIHRAVAQHHERLDGSGYPLGLRGDDVCAEARILGVADVYEAMVSHRPYRPARLTDEALAELRDGSGTRYDPVVVDGCLSVLGAGFAFVSDR